MNHRAVSTIGSSNPYIDTLNQVSYSISRIHHPLYVRVQILERDAYFSGNFPQTDDAKRPEEDGHRLIDYSLRTFAPSEW